MISKLTLGVALIFSGAASAAVVPLAVMEEVNSQWAMSGQTNFFYSSVSRPSLAAPVRTSQIKIRIQKVIAVKSPNGNTNFRVDDVCTGSSPLNVYDYRNGGGGIDPKNLDLFSCTADLAGSEIQVHVGAFMTLRRRVLFSVLAEDLKSAYPVLWYSQRNGSRVALPVTSAFVGTSDVGSHSPLLSQIQPAIGSVCTEAEPIVCEPAIREFFSALVSIED